MSGWWSYAAASLPRERENENERVCIYLFAEC